VRAWVRCAGVMNRLVGGAGAGKAIGPMAKATARAAVLKYIQENMTLPSVTNLEQLTKPQFQALDPASFIDAWR